MSFYRVAMTSGIAVRLGVETILRDGAILLTATSILLTLHLAAVSVASVGPCFAIWLRWHARRHPCDAANTLGRAVAVGSLRFLLVGAVLGLLQLALIWDADNQAYIQALRTIKSSRWWSTGAEFVFSAVCLAIYAVAWNRWQRRFWLHTALALVAATNLLYHFPTLFVLAGVVAERPDLWSKQTNIPDMLVDPNVLARVFHYLLAAISLTGIYVMLLAARATEDAARLISRCGQLAFGAAFFQLPMGIVVLIQLPLEIRDALLGRNRLATCFLGAGVILSLVLLHHLAAVAMGDHERPTLRRSAFLMLLVLFFMVTARGSLRGDVVDRGHGSSIRYEAVRHPALISRPLAESIKRA